MHAVRANFSWPFCPAAGPCCLAATPVRRGPRPRSFSAIRWRTELQAIRNDRFDQQPPAAVTSYRRVAPAGPLGPARTDEPTGARGPARWRAPMISSTGEIGLPAGRPRRRAPASGGGPAATTSRRITASGCEARCLGAVIGSCGRDSDSGGGSVDA